MYVRFPSARVLVFVLYLIAAAWGAAACSALASKPVVIISAPAHGSQFHEGEDVAVQSTSTDTLGITRVELLVDNAVVRTDTVPGAQGQPSFTLVQSWKAVSGTHNIAVRAVNASNAMGDPAVISISVVPATALVPTTVPPVVSPPTPTATVVVPRPATATATATTAPPPPGPCTNALQFVADVTVPDGTLLAPSQAFNKIWRVRNTGTCNWDAGYQFVYVGGEAMATVAAIAVPYTTPGATADLLIAMTAPATPGVHSGQWRMKSGSGALFGATLTVNINVINPGGGSQPPPPPATGCTGTASISSFTASATTINAGQSTTLQWGLVSNADSVEIDHGIGGIATPGSVTVTPGSTTTYTLTAHCGASVVTGAVTITVQTVGPPPVAPSTSQVLAQVNIGAGATGNVSAACPAGTVVTGGGYATTTDAGFIVYNSTKDGNGWHVYARNASGASHALNAYAICLANTSGTSNTTSAVQVTVPAHAANNATANCPAGSVVTGGGFALNNDEEVYTQIKSGNGWQVYAFNNGAGGQLLNVYAICLSGTSATTTQSAVQQSSVGAGGSGSASASCSSGVLVGGAFASPSGLTTKVYTQMKSGNGWVVYLHNDGGSTALVNAYAICANF